MKKTLIALALVSLPVAASAEVILYGNIRGGVEYTRHGAHDQAGDTAKDAWGVVDYSSYIGFKGSEDLGNNLKAIWQVETRAKLDASGLSGKRDTFIGLEGGFGTVKVGHVSSPLKEAVDNQDNWEYDSPILGLGIYTRYGQRRTSLNYQSPDFGGFDFAFQLTPGSNAHDGSRTDDGRPVFGLGLGYKNSGFFARYAVEYARKAAPGVAGTPPLATPEAKDSHVHNLSAGYDANNLYVAAGFQYGKNVSGDFEDSNGDIAIAGPVGTPPTTVVGGAGSDKTKEAQISAAYTFGAVTPKISVAYGRADSTNTAIDGARYLQAVVGADYAFSRRTTGLVSVGWLRAKENTGAKNINNWGVGTGLVHKF